MAAIFDPLFCSEEPFIEELYEEKNQLFCSPEPNSDSSEFLASLIAGEQKGPSFVIAPAKLDDPYLYSARKDAVRWIKATSARFGFSALTVILAVDYLDRCFMCSAGLRLQQDKPWMKQLSAVACLALAAKVEETRVPFMLDLQIPPAAAEEVAGFVFESKTIRRMELLVLSTLGWRMNPVTALSFIQCILPNLERDFGCNAVQILTTCESILLAVLSDWRWVQFPPSALAAAAMLHSTGLHCDEMHHILNLLQVSKERAHKCYELIVELIGGAVVKCNNKRKSCCCYSDDHHPPSPNGVIGSCFSYESSSLSSSTSLDSWGVWPSSVSSSPEPPPYKRPNCFHHLQNASNINYDHD